MAFSQCCFSPDSSIFLSFYQTEPEWVWPWYLITWTIDDPSWLSFAIYFSPHRRTTQLEFWIFHSNQLTNDRCSIVIFNTDSNQFDSTIENSGGHSIPPSQHLIWWTLLTFSSATDLDSIQSKFLNLSNFTHFILHSIAFSLRFSNFNPSTPKLLSNFMKLLIWLIL